jgi:hypothetical protein
VIISGANTSTYIASQSGDYVVIISNANCSTTSSPLTIEVIANPATPSIIANGNVLSTVDTYITYQWYLNGTIISGATNRSYTALVNGSYTVVVSNYAGCENTSQAFVLTNVDVPTVNGAKQVAIYPNPTSGKVHIVAATPVNVSVRDMSGKEIIHLAETKEVNLEAYADGIYFLHISDLNGTPIRKERVMKSTK